MSTQQKVPGCSCQLCNPSFVDVQAPPIQQDPDGDTDWSVLSDEKPVVRFHGKIVSVQPVAESIRN